MTPPSQPTLDREGWALAPLSFSRGCHGIVGGVGAAASSRKSSVLKGAPPANQSHAGGTGAEGNEAGAENEFTEASGHQLVQALLGLDKDLGFCSTWNDGEPFRISKKQC